MPMAIQVTQMRPPASPAVLRSLPSSLWSPFWDLPLLEHEVKSMVPPLASHRSLSSREDGSKSPGPKVHEAHPGPLASTCPSPLPVAPTAPSPGSASAGPDGSSGSIPHELRSPCPGVPSPPLLGRGPHVSPEEFRSPSSARSR